MPSVTAHPTLTDLFPARPDDAAGPVEARVRALSAMRSGSAEAVDARTAARAVRLVARAAAMPPREAAPLAGLRWETAQVLRLLRDDRRDGAEAEQVSAVLAALAVYAPAKPALLGLALRGYAAWLERAGRYEEALATLSLAVAVGGVASTAAAAASVALQAGRLRLELRDEAGAAQAAARAASLAREVGDAGLLVRARLLQAQVLREHGRHADAAEALRQLEAAVDPAAFGLCADVLLERACLASARGRFSDATDLAYRALSLADDDARRARILLVLGDVLRLGGHVTTALEALELALGMSTDAAVRSAALAGLLEASSLVPDRLAFERIWRDARDLAPSLPAALRVPLAFRAGVGYARFHRALRAQAVLTQAREAALQALLHDWTAAIDRVLMHLHACGDPDGGTIAPTPLAASVSSGLDAFARARASA